MKLLELFSGSCTVSTEAKKRGCDVRNLDIIGDPTYKEDILKWDYKEALKDWKPDIIWASPPCDSFSFAQNLNIGRGFPPDIEKGRRLMLKTIEIVDWALEQNPNLLFIIENSLGRMRNQPEIQKYKRQTLSQCHYGRPYRKNTDLWNNIPNLQLKRCKKDCPSIVNGKHPNVCLNGRTIRETLQPTAGKRESIQSIPTPLISSILDQVGL
jgi:site-specific DNA-cytosine methylase